MMFKGGPVKSAPKTFQKPQNVAQTKPSTSSYSPPVGMNADRKRMAMQKMVQMDSKIKS